jgi:hypothetical protein
MRIERLSLPGHELEIVAADLEFRSLYGLRLPGFTGSAWRGAFGHSLKAIACLGGATACADSCRSPYVCAYPVFFEANAGRPATDGTPEIPRPYVLAPPWTGSRDLTTGEVMTVRLTLVGGAVSNMALAVRAMADAARRGIGPHRGALELSDVRQVPVVVAVPAGDQVVVELASPLRLTVENRLVREDGFAPRHLLIALLRRISNLVRHHSNGTIEADFRSLKTIADTASFGSREITWSDWTRASSRQERLMPMGGLVGRVALLCSEVEAFLPFLAAAPWLGVGRGTTMGLGSIRLHPLGTG